MKIFALFAALAAVLSGAQPAIAAPLPGESKYDCVYRHIRVKPAAQRVAHLECGCSGFEDMSKICRPAENAARAEWQRNGAAPNRAPASRGTSQAAVGTSRVGTYECFVSVTEGRMPKVQVRADSDDAAKAEAERVVGKRAFRDTASCRKIADVPDQHAVQPQAPQHSPAADRRAPQTQDPADALKGAIGEILKRK